MNSLKPKYKKGDKFEIEIAEVHTHYKDRKPYSVYRVKGFDSMFMTDYALDRLRLKEALKLKEEPKVGDEVDYMYFKNGSWHIQDEFSKFLLHEKLEEQTEEGDRYIIKLIDKETNKTSYYITAYEVRKHIDNE